MSRLLFIALCFVSCARAATITSLATVTGNWSSGGTWVGGVAPTDADDALIVLTSGTITIDAGSVCRSANFTGTTATITHTAGVTLTIGKADGTAGLSNVALLMVAGMTYTPSADTCAITFIGTCTTAQTVTLGGKTTGNVTFNGTGGYWQLVDAMTGRSTITTTLTLTAGRFDTANQNVSYGIMSWTGSTARRVTWGSSLMLSAKNTSGIFFDVSNGTNLTIDSNTATIRSTGGTAFFTAATSGSAVDFNGLSFEYVPTAGATLGINLNGSTIKNFLFTGAASLSSFMTVASNVTVSGTFTANGNSATNSIDFLTSAFGTQRVWNFTGTPAFAVTNCNFIDTSFTGVSADFSAVATVGNCGNNSGITFSTPRTLYWIGNTGSWGTAANWSTTSGGSADVTVFPRAHDTARFDANSHSANGQTVTVNVKFMAGSIDCTGMTRTGITWSMDSAVPNFFGSCTGPSVGAISTTNASWAAESASAFTLTMGNLTIGTGSNFTILAQGACTLVGDITVSGTLSINCTGGFTPTTSGALITAGLISLSGGTINGGTNTIWTANSTTNAWNMSSPTWNAQTSTIVMSCATGVAGSFIGNGKTYNRVQFTGDNITITGNNTFARLDVNNAGRTNGLIIGTGSTQTVTGLVTCNGSPGSLCVLKGVSGGGTETLTSSFYMQQLDYMTISDLTAAGTAKWYAGWHSTNVTGNSGWQLVAGASTFNSAGIRF